MLKAGLESDVIKTSAREEIHKEVTGTQSPREESTAGEHVPLSASALPPRDLKIRAGVHHTQASGPRHLLEGFLKISQLHPWSSCFSGSGLEPVN